MHSLGLYHRDIKPENIFLSSSGALKIGDFGLATMDTWSFESAVGSDRYMAPEQYDPQDMGYSPAKADIWALGICLLNMLFSKNPFNNPSVSDQLFVDFAKDRQTLFDVFPTMSQDAFEVLIHSLAIDPTRRSLADMKAALKRVVAFTTDDESLDEFCVEESVAKVTTNAREPLRTPSLSSGQFDENGAFMWAKNLPLLPPVRQLSAIPDEFSEDLFPSSEDRSSQDWGSMKPDNESVVSFVDSGLGVSLKSSNVKPEPVKADHSKPVVISGSLPATLARPIPSMSGVFGKKRDVVSKSWSDLWDEDEELERIRASVEVENDVQPRGRNWPEEVGGRDTPRAGLAEMKNPSVVHNSRNRSPSAARALDERVSQHTGFIFEEDEAESSTPKATPATPVSLAIKSRYRKPDVTMDHWAALGEKRRGAAPTPTKETHSPPQTTPTDGEFPTAVPPSKRNRAGSWRPNLNWHPFEGRKTTASKEPWSVSKDWRQHRAPPAQSRARSSTHRSEKLGFDWPFQSTLPPDLQPQREKQDFEWMFKSSLPPQLQPGSSAQGEKRSFEWVWRGGRLPALLHM